MFHFDSHQASNVFRGFEILNIYQSKSSDQIVATERSQCSPVGLFKPGTGLPAWVVRSLHGLFLLIVLQSYVTAFTRLVACVEMWLPSLLLFSSLTATSLCQGIYVRP